MKTILILGAVSDIAEQIAYQYAVKNYTLILASRNSDRLMHLKSDIEVKHNVPVHVVEFDAVNFSSHQSFYLNLPVRPECVCCVFGYLGEQEIAEKNEEECMRILNTNYVGAVSILNCIANEFEKQKEGTIIGISSVAGDRGRKSNYLYGSAKAGFTTYLSGLRNRLYSSDVHVLTVKPGFVDTQMTKDLSLPPLLTASPNQVAKDIYKAMEKKKNVLYTKWFWKYIMFIIKQIPEPIFKKLSL